MPGMISTNINRACAWAVSMSEASAHLHSRCNIVAKPSSWRKARSPQLLVTLERLGGGALIVGAGDLERVCAARVQPMGRTRRGSTKPATTCPHSPANSSPAPRSGTHPPRTSATASSATSLTPWRLPLSPPRDPMVPRRATEPHPDTTDGARTLRRRCGMAERLQSVAHLLGRGDAMKLALIGPLLRFGDHAHETCSSPCLTCFGRSRSGIAHSDRRRRSKRHRFGPSIAHQQ